MVCGRCGKNGHNMRMKEYEYLCDACYDIESDIQ